MNQNLAVGVVGKSGVGKTSLIEKFMDPKYDTLASTVSTKSCCRKTKRIPIHDVEYTIDLWDTVGQERFNSIPQLFYHHKDAIIFVYDVTDVVSFQTLQHFVDAARSAVPSTTSTIFAVFGNKYDLSDDKKVSETDAKAYSDSIGATHFNVTATDASSVHNVLCSLIEQIIRSKQHHPDEHAEDSITIDEKTEKCSVLTCC